MERRKVKKLNAKQLGFLDDETVCINQSLKPYRRNIYGQARKMKRDINYAYLWVDNSGRIKLRGKKEGNKAVHVLKHLKM
jgi:hypothetical protein